MTDPWARRKTRPLLLMVAAAIIATAAVGTEAAAARGGQWSGVWGNQLGGRGGGRGLDRTGVVVAFETPDQEQFQYGRPGEAVFGAYSWVSPEGVQVVIRYVADAAGFRVIGGPVPRDSRGVAADGLQVFPRAADGSLILT
ncbi:endocuticle structural glycoprotein SgAbd-9-like [Eriocheir sinensis]|uniref:endocuticle structural glycoprotein SgAbd-9-like n=1 Tax=Eriocheir sinensis TaxID=95602 RepID=UPI0021CAAF54|nr:endocuticle structural glycoprotein SgAbd-9-like [Eriocheir sinensis]